MRRRPPTLQEAQHADVERGWQEAADLLLPWDVKLVHRAKRWTRILAATGAFLGAGAAAVGAAVKAWRVVRTGSVAPAELPATGQPTIATDRVQKPPPKP